MKANTYIIHKQSNSQAQCACARPKPSQRQAQLIRTNTTQSEFVRFVVGGRRAGDPFPWRDPPKDLSPRQP
eukprot:587047-Amphidinium_carterae.1